MQVLLSYAYIKSRKSRLARFVSLTTGPVEFMIDSGAYTAYTQGKPIALDEYIDFCKEYGQRVWNYVMLDVIRNPQATLDNLETMVAAGLRPMPVLPLHSPEENMRRYVEVNEWVCVAGGATEEKEYYRARIQRAWLASGKRARIHGLGYGCGIEPLRSAVQSADSSSWMIGQMFGILQLFTPEDGMKNWQIGNLYKRQPFGQWPSALKRWFVESALPASDLTKKETWSGAFSRISLSHVVEWIKYQRYMTSHGCRMFLANMGSSLPALAVAMRCIREDGHLDWEKAKREVVEVQKARRSGWEDFCSYFRDSAAALAAA